MLIHRIPLIGISPEILIQQLQTKSDASIRFALILILGQYERAELTQKYVVELKRQAKSSNAGIHSAAQWALRQLGENTKLEPQT